EMAWALADEICKRFPVEMFRFGSSGTEATMHAIRLARAATGRDRIVKMEGGYHGLHDSALVSVKPKSDQFGDPAAPTPVPAGAGVTTATLQNTLVAPFNDLAAVERLFAAHTEIGRASCRERGAIAGSVEASRRRHTRCYRDWSSDVCSSDLVPWAARLRPRQRETEKRPVR